MSEPHPQPPLWSWQELQQAVGLPVTPPAAGGASVQEVHGIEIDSRKLSPGELFIALKGDPGPRFTATDRSDRDGDDFVAAAVDAGAAGLLVQRPHPELAVPQLVVDDTLDALWQLGAWRRRGLTGPVVAITGSSGKTTCKTFLAAALGAFASAGSLNNHLGVPLSLARTPVGDRAAVYELGMNHPGEIAPLSRLVQPQLAVVLNVHAAHAEAFDDADGIRREKLSIAQGLVGPKILVVDDAVALAGLPQGLRIVRFGSRAESDVQLLDCRGDQARYRVGAQECAARVPGGGRHRALTLAAVLAVLQALGRDLQPALALPAELVPRGRGTVSRHGGVELIDDSYNANPGSMTAALTALAQAEGAGRQFALLGEMLELGEQSAAAHLALQPYCQALDGVLLVGAALAPLAEALGTERCLGWWPDLGATRLPECAKVLSELLKDGDKLLIKGSNRIFWQRDVVASLAATLEAAS